jgi:hypothetical protein
MKKFMVAISLLLLYGCSVGMALSGKREPNIDIVKVGSTRGEIELHLGPSTTSKKTVDGTRIDVYEHEIGNEPSAGRAIGHAAMDILTLGIWEMVGTPIEASQGDKRQITIKYDNDNRVEAITSKILPKPASLPTSTHSR